MLNKKEDKTMNSKEVWIKETVKYHVKGDKIICEGKSKLAEQIAWHKLHERIREILKSGKPGVIKIEYVK